MDIQSSVLNELFALFPVIVQGWVTPVRPVNTADGGIPKSLYDGQPKGLECLVDPWVERFNQAVAVDDRVDLFINSGVTPVDGKTISSGEENLRVRLYVPKGRLRDGVNQIYYRVTRASGNGSEDSRKLSVLYHRYGPGETAPDAIRLLIPDDVVANGVGPEPAARGVDFGLEYDNRRPYDFISLTLGSRGLVELELTPEEGDSGQPLVQTLFTDTFKQNPDNPRTPVFYSVTDQLGNFSLSATQYIDVHVNRVMLTPPDLSENPDDPSDDPDTIDLGKVKDFLYVLVHVFSPLWVTNDIVRVSYTCTPPAPGKVVTHSAEATVSRLPFTHKLQVPVAKVLPNSTVSVIYEQVRDSKVMGTSKPAEARVIGESVTEPPTITSVKGLPSDVEIPENTSTSETSFVFSGTASANQTIELRDAGVKKDTIAVGLTGDWTHTLNGQAVGVHKYTVKATYGGLPESKPWVLTVEQRIYFEDFETWPLVTIKAPGQLITGRTMVVHYVSGKGEVRIAKAPYSNGSERSLYLYNEGGQYIRLQFKWSCSKVSFFIADVAYPGQYVNAYDSNRNLLDRKELPAGNRPVTLTLSSSGPKIESLEFLLGESFDPIPLDDFLFVD